MFNPSETNRHHASETFDMKVASRQATEFAKIENELIELAKIAKAKVLLKDLVAGSNKEPVIEISWNPDYDYISIASMFTNITGLVGLHGNRAVLYHDRKVDFVPGHKGMFKSQNMLATYYHTDIPTFEYVQKLLRVSLKAFSPHTEYYFDESGNFAKLVAVPKNTTDARVPHHYDYIFGEDVPHIPSEMTPGDFEIVGTIFAQIKRGLQEFITTSRESTPSPEGL